MRVLAQPLQFIRTLEALLPRNDPAAVEALLQQTGLPALLQPGLLDLACATQHRASVALLSTLVACNSTDTTQARQAEWLLAAWQAAAQQQQQLPASLADLSPDHVVRVAATALATRTAVVPARSATTCRRGTAADWLLAVSLCVDHGHWADATTLLRDRTRLPPTPGLARRLGQALHLRVTLALDHRPHTDWRSAAQALQVINSLLRGQHDAELREHLRLKAADCLLRAGDTDTALALTRQAESGPHALRAGVASAKVLCHAGQHASAIAQLDRVLQQFCRQQPAQAAPAVLSAPQGSDAAGDSGDADGAGTGSDTFDTGAAAQALRELQEDLAPVGQQPFLVSGTLLGQVRDGGLMAHDKDVDVGLLGWEDQYDVMAALLRAGRFDLNLHQLRGRRCHVVAVRHHRTGICIDIFFYHPRADGRWVTGVDHDFGYTQQFAFTPFETRAVDFLGTTCRVPVDAELNLRENYGDWRTPDTGYITHLESPSTVDPGGEIWMLVARLRLLDALNQRQPERVSRVARLLQRHADRPLALAPALLAALCRRHGLGEPGASHAAPAAAPTPAHTHASTLLNREAVHAD